MKRLPVLTLLFFIAALSAAHGESFRFRSVYTPQAIEQFFAKTYTDDIELTARWILDPARARDTYTRFLMVADYIDLGNNLSYLNKYGLEKASGKSYRIDLAKHPGWVTVRNLNSTLHEGRMTEADWKTLESRGLNENEIAAIRDYTRKPGINEAIHSHYRSYILANGHALAAKYFAENTSKFEVFTEYRDTINALNLQLDIEWLGGLLRQLELASQKTLLAFLYEKVGEILIFPSSGLDGHIELFFRSLQDGSLQKKMQESASQAGNQAP